MLINRDQTPYDRYADLIIREPIAQVFAQLLALMGKPLNGPS